MTTARKVTALAAVALALSCSLAAADPATSPSTATGPLHLSTSSRVVTDGGSDVHLPPGYFLSESQWDTLDLEVHRLQDTETRLTAENASLRKSMSGWQPGWWTIATVTATALAAGWYAKSKI